MLNLDTHIVVAILSGDLSEQERDLLVAQPWAVSDIVYWELAKLVQLGRLVCDFEDPAFQRFVAQTVAFCVTPAIAKASTQLDFESDPADELIAATSLIEGIPLLTRDARILSSKLVPFP